MPVFLPDNDSVSTRLQQSRERQFRCLYLGPSIN